MEHFSATPDWDTVLGKQPWWQLHLSKDLRISPLGFPVNTACKTRRYFLPIWTKSRVAENYIFEQGSCGPGVIYLTRFTEDLQKW